MAEWPLTGRNAELSRLRAAALDPSCRGVVLAAPAGVGKTRLATEVRRTAEHAGLFTVVATANPTVAGVPLGAMASLISAFGGMPGAAHEDPGGFLQDVVQHLLDHLNHRRVCVVVDDAHLLDNVSAALVQQLAQRTEVFLLLTLRAREPAPDAVTALWKDGVVERLDLHELDIDAVEQLLTAVLGGPVDRASVTALNSRSQGNLLYLREMVIAARNDGSLRFDHELWRLVRESPLSDLLIELVEARLGRLSADQRHLLELLAVGEPLGSHELSQLSSFNVAEHLEDVGLIASRNDGRRLELRLAHPLYGEVLRSRLSGLRSRRLARSLAQVLEATGLNRRDDVLRVAVWRLTAGGGSTDHLLAAALIARWRHDLSLAHRLAAAAAAGGAGFEAELLTAQLLLRLGRSAEADAAFARLCNAPGERERVRATLARVDIAHARDCPQEMRELLATLQPLPSDGDLRAAIAARACIATVLLEGPRAALDAPVPEFDVAQGDAAFALFSARAACHSLMGRPDLAGQELERMQSAGADSARLGWWRIPNTSVISSQLVQAGRLRESIDLLQAQYDGAVAIGAAEVQMAAGFALARRQVEAGRMRIAGKLTHEALALSEQFHYPLVRGEALRVLATIEAMTGLAEQARRTLTEVRTSTTEHAYSVGLAGEADAWIQVGEGDLDGARRTFLDTAAACQQIGDLVHVASALHGLVRIGHPQLAVNPLAELATSMAGPWTSLFLRHGRALCTTDGAELLAVAREFESLGAFLLAAETAADASRVFSDLGEDRLSTAARNLAVGLADVCQGVDTPPLRGLGPREPLSPAEAETAHLAAAGESNKAIAQKLQFSVRTVETRLQSVYYKLGISRREELAAALPTGQASAAPIRSPG